MKYRIGTLIHDCDVADNRGGSLPYWDRGNWFVGIEALEHKKPICPHCKSTLADPLRSNRIQADSVQLFSEAFKKQVTYPAIYIETVDLRKKEYKQ